MTLLGALRSANHDVELLRRPTAMNGKHRCRPERLRQAFRASEPNEPALSRLVTFDITNNRLVPLLSPLCAVTDAGARKRNLKTILRTAKQKAAMESGSAVRKVSVMDSRQTGG